MGYWSEKVVIVTGGSSGLGWAISETFGAAGARVVIASRQPERLEEAVQRARAAGWQADGVSTDVTDDGQVDALIKTIVDRYGRIDALVNNAGVSMRGEASETTVERFRELLEINFLAAVRCTRAALPHLLAAKGHLVNLGSLAAKSAGKHLGAYPASKFPLAAYSHQLRLELSERGLHVLLVCPGPIARGDAGQRYDAQATELPDSAKQPGGGVKLKGLDPHHIARRILDGCEQRRAELVMPYKAKWLFAISQLSPAWGDWILRRMTE